MALARDIGSPSKTDPYFPTVRQKDWYIGSSWATGIGGGTRQEESSSEVNIRVKDHLKDYWGVTRQITGTAVGRHGQHWLEARGKRSQVWCSEHYLGGCKINQTLHIKLYLKYSLQWWNRVSFAILATTTDYITGL